MRPRPPRGELEGDGCPRRRLEEGQANGLALERIPDTSLRKRPCQVEDLPDVLAANVFQGKKALVSNDDHPVLPIGLLQVDKHSFVARGGTFFPT